MSHNENRGTGSRSNTGGGKKGYATEDVGGTPNYQPNKSAANGIPSDFKQQGKKNKMKGY